MKGVIFLIGPYVLILGTEGEAASIVLPQAWQTESLNPKPQGFKPRSYQGDVYRVSGSGFTITVWGGLGLRVWVRLNQYTPSAHKTNLVLSHVGYGFGVGVWA